MKFYLFWILYTQIMITEKTKDIKWFRCKKMKIGKRKIKDHYFFILSSLIFFFFCMPRLPQFFCEFVQINSNMQITVIIHFFKLIQLVLLFKIKLSEKRVERLKIKIFFYQIDVFSFCVSVTISQIHN